MSRILLVSNSHHDRPTEYLTSWFEKIVEVAKNQTDVKIIELKKEQSNKKEVVDMIEKGIIDPAKVIKCALRNSVSVAIQFLTINVIITPPNEKPNVPNVSQK